MYRHHFIFIVLIIYFTIFCNSQAYSKDCYCECKPKNHLLTCDCKTVCDQNNNAKENAHTLLVSSQSFAIPRSGNVLVNMIEFIKITDVNIPILNSIESEIKMENLTHLTLKNCEIQDINKTAFNNTRYITHLNMENNLISILSEDTFIFVKRLHYLNLKNNTIEEIPENIFRKLSNLTELHLSSNNILHLPENLFNSLNNLTYIHLNNNKIKTVPSNLFANNRQLGKIYLNNNNIHELSKEVFQGLTNVYEIYLDNNQIMIIPNGLFKNLSKLQSIKLEHNKIHIIHSEAFMNNPKLKAVFLNNNHIKNIHPNIITTSPRLRFLNIINNEIICDCKLKPFFSASRKLNLTISIECFQPKVHKSFRHLSLNDFVCPPKILNCTSNKLENISYISCKIYGDPTPKFVWMFQGEQIKHNECFEVSYGDIDEDHFWANLTIFNITSNSKGNYTLNVTSKGGDDLYIYEVLFDEDSEITVVAVVLVIIVSVLVFLAFIICVSVCVKRPKTEKPKEENLLADTNNNMTNYLNTEENNNNSFLDEYKDNTDVVHIINENDTKTKSIESLDNDKSSNDQELQILPEKREENEYTIAVNLDNTHLNTSSQNLYEQESEYSDTDSDYTSSLEPIAEVEETSDENDDGNDNEEFDYICLKRSTNLPPRNRTQSESIVLEVPVNTHTSLTAGQHTTSLCSTNNSEQEVIVFSTMQSETNSGSLDYSVYSESSYSAYSTRQQRARMYSNVSRVESSNFSSTGMINSMEISSTFQDSKIPSLEWQ